MMRFEEFLKALDEEEFVQAHEILEHSWKELKISGKKEEALFLKGLINGATSIALYDKGKIDGAKRIWKAYEKYIIYKNLFKNGTIDNIIIKLEECKKRRF